MYKDGSNPENVDPVPALNWTGKDSFKQVVVHGMRVSPAVTKLLAYLQYYKIPFTYKPGAGKKGSKYYKKMPVLDVDGRQVNDTFIIIKNLVPALSGTFDAEWETRLTYHYQMSTLYSSPNADIAKNFGGKNGDFPLPRCLFCMVFNFVRPGALKKLKAKMDDPNELEQLVDLTAFAKEFKDAMGEKPFYHGDEPGQKDISFYGVNARYVFCECSYVCGALESAGLMEWWKRMEELIPLSGKPGAMFEKL